MGELSLTGEAERCSGETGQRARGGVAPGQVVQTSLQRYLRKGKAMGGLGRDKSKDQGQRALDEPTVHLLKTLTKLTLRLEEEMGRFRADTCFMLFVDTVTEQNTLQLLKEAAQGWQTAFEEGKVTTSLRIILLGGLLTKLKEVLLQVNTDDGLRSRLMTVGWRMEGATALTPAWNYYRWDPDTRQQVKDDKPPLSHDRALQCVETLQRTLCDPAVLLRFRAAHRLGMDTQAEVVPFKMAISLRGQASVDAGSDGPLLLGRVQAPGAPIATGAHAEIAVGTGVRGGLPEHELHRLDPPQASGEPRLAV